MNTMSKVKSSLSSQLYNYVPEFSSEVFQVTVQYYIVKFVTSNSKLQKRLMIHNIYLQKNT